MSDVIRFDVFGKDDSEERNSNNSKNFNRTIEHDDLWKALRLTNQKILDAIRYDESNECENAINAYSVSIICIDERKLISI